MKRIYLYTAMIFWTMTMHAGNCRQDTTTYNVKSTIESLYSTFIPLLDRVEIAGNSEVSNELRYRWNEVVRYLMNNKDHISDEVMRLIVSPSGQKIDLELVKKFINVTEKDSVKKITVNPDFLLDELNILGKRLTDEAIKMTEKK